MDMSFVYSGGCCLSNWQAEEVDTNKWRMNLDQASRIFMIFRHVEIMGAGKMTTTSTWELLDY